MIYPANKFKIYLATMPVDFRKGMDGLANYVASNFDLDPFSGAFFVFRSKGKDRMKVLMWDGTGLVLIYKRIEGNGFCWPKLSEGNVTMTKAQFEALFEGIDWRHVSTPVYSHPRASN